MKPICCIILTVICFAVIGMAEEADILMADFESEDYGAWTTTGEAFGPGPARGTLPNQMEVTGFEGRRLVNSFYQGDGSVGTLISPVFKIERNYINFLIGGGGYPETTCIQLLLDGEIVRTAAGPNTTPGGSERLAWKHWDVKEWKGKEAMIRIVDNRTEGWGHINVDHILQSNEIASREKVREITAEKRFLNFPVKNGAPKTWFRLLADTAILREFDLELAPSPEETHFWVTLDISAFAGAKLVLWAENIVSRSQGFDMIVQADQMLQSDGLYQEKHRPQFHFSAQRGWLNDPNGLVFYDGEYHLFFQHNPYGWNWGNMTWGHAVSTDLVHWKELGDAIHPDEHGTIFSGSAVVDWNNTTGFQSGALPPLVCIYTYAGGHTLSSKGVPFTQGIAYSNDRGRTWTKYAGNPVQGPIAGDNRDPKVIWHAPTQQWVIALYLDKKEMAFFTSKDLKTWTLTSRFESIYECPELFQLLVDGDEAQPKWIVYGASGDYYIGDFDGSGFESDGDALRFNYGDSFYASQTFSDIPPEDGRRIQIAWGQTGHRDMPFNQMMNFPVELALRTTDDGPRLFAWPVREAALLHQRTHAWTDLDIKDATQVLASVQGDLFDIHARFKLDKAREVGLVVNGLTIAYDARKQELRCNDKTASASPEEGSMDVRILADRLSVEIFAQQGRIYMPMKQVREEDISGIEVYSKGGEARLTQLTVHEMASAWEQGKQGAYAD